MIRIGTTLPVQDSSATAGVRRQALQCANALGFSETAAGRAALVATEVATNLVKHGQGGTMLFGSDQENGAALVMVGLDKGRGIANVRQAMEDGYSTAGSPGTGLGAISRNASSLDLFTQPGAGTAILCRIEAEATRPPLVPERTEIGGVCVAKSGEEHSGDSWVAVHGQEFTTIAVADGLGHGVFASTASTAAVRAIAASATRPLEAIFAEIHGVLRATRGAAVGIARIHHGQNRIEFMGVGNIAGQVLDPESNRRTVSQSGIVGHEMRRVQSYSYPWNSTAVLVLASDGISTSWNAAMYPGLLQRDPALISAVLFRDHCRGNDDSTVVTVKAR